MNFFCYTGHDSELSLNLQLPTSSVLELSTVEATPLFDVLFRGYIYPKLKTRPICVACVQTLPEACLVPTLSSKAKKLKWNHLNVIYEKAGEMEDSQSTRILTRFTAKVYSDAEWTNI